VDEPSATTNDNPAAAVDITGVVDLVTSVLLFSVDFPLLMLIRGSVFLFAPPFSVGCGAGMVDFVANALLPLLRLPIPAGAVEFVAVAVAAVLVVVLAPLLDGVATRTGTGTRTATDVDVDADMGGTKAIVSGLAAAVLLFSSCACPARGGVEEVAGAHLDLFRFVFLVDDIVAECN